MRYTGILKHGPAEARLARPGDLRQHVNLVPSLAQRHNSLRMAGVAHDIRSIRADKVEHT